MLGIGYKLVENPQRAANNSVEELNYKLVHCASSKVKFVDFKRTRSNKAIQGIKSQHVFLI